MYYMYARISNIKCKFIDQFVNILFFLPVCRSVSHNLLSAKTIDQRRRL